MKPSPIQQVFSQLEFGGSRTEWRRSQGIADDSDQPHTTLAELAAPATDQTDLGEMTSRSTQL